MRKQAVASCILLGAACFVATASAGEFADYVSFLEVPGNAKDLSMLEDGVNTNRLGG